MPCPCCPSGRLIPSASICMLCKMSDAPDPKIKYVRTYSRQCGGSLRFQDGAASANNPAALALTEARLLWPDTPISCLVSLGSGAVPLQRREKSMSAYLDIGSVLIEVTVWTSPRSCGIIFMFAQPSQVCRASVAIGCHCEPIEFPDVNANWLPPQCLKSCGLV